MKCLNCGRVYGDEQRFCTECGEALVKEKTQSEKKKGFYRPHEKGMTELEEELAKKHEEPEEAYEEPEETYEEPEKVMQRKVYFSGGMNKDTDEVDVREDYPKKKETVKKEKVKKVKKETSGNSLGKMKVGIIAATIVVAVLVVGVIVANIFFKAQLRAIFPEKEVYVYVSDGEYYLMTGQKKPVKVDSTKTEDAYYTFAEFSPDGKYLYYTTKINAKDYSGTLNRVSYKNITGEMNHDEKYKEVIAKDVNVYDLWLYGMEFFNDGSFVYEDIAYTLYYYDGKDSNQIEKEVDDFYVDGSGVVVYEKNDKVYAVNRKKIDERKKIASGEIYSFLDKNSVFVREIKSDSTYLYVAGYDREPDLLTKDLAWCGTLGETFYYFEENSSKEKDIYSLYGYTSKGEVLISDSVVEYLDSCGNAIMYVEAESPEQLEWEDVLSGDAKLMLYTGGEKGDETIAVLGEALNTLLEKDEEYSKELSGTEVFSFRDNKFYALIGHAYGYCELEDGEFRIFTEIDDDVEDFWLTENGSLYAAGAATEDGQKIVDLYSATKKEKKRSLTEKKYNNISVYAYTDGVTAVVENAAEDCISVIDANGNETISIQLDDLSFFMRSTSKNYLYIEDGDLYLYSGNKPKLLAKEVERVYSKNYMERVK